MILSNRYHLYEWRCSCWTTETSAIDNSNQVVLHGHRSPRPEPGASMHHILPSFKRTAFIMKGALSQRHTHTHISCARDSWHFAKSWAGMSRMAVNNGLWWIIMFDNSFSACVEWCLCDTPKSHWPRGAGVVDVPGMTHRKTTQQLGLWSQSGTTQW